MCVRAVLLLSQLKGDETSLRLRVHNKTLLSNSLIGTARLPIDFLIVLHATALLARAAASPSAASDSHHFASCANLDSQTFWTEIGREARQSVPAGAVLLSVNEFVWESKEDEDALRAAVTARYDRRASLPSLLQRDGAASKEQSQTEAERERKDRSQSVTADASPAASAAAAAAAQHEKKPSIASPTRPPLPSQQSSFSSHSSFSVPSAQAFASSSSGLQPSSALHSRQSSTASGGGVKARLFGGPLSNGISRSKGCVPVVVFVCIQYLIYHGLGTVGLFRISPSSVMVDSIKLAFENGDSVNISDPHATAAVLKSYFRELTEPLIPYAAFAAFIAAVDSREPDASYARLRECCRSLLQEDNRLVLSFLLHFLTLVASQQPVNKMSPRNLAVVWAPNILRGPASSSASSQQQQPAPPPVDQQQMAREMQRAEECVVLLIEGYHAVFPEGPPRPFALEVSRASQPQPALHSPLSARAHCLATCCAVLCLCAEQHPQKERAQVATPRQAVTKGTNALIVDKFTLNAPG